MVLLAVGTRKEHGLLWQTNKIYILEVINYAVADTQSIHYRDVYHLGAVWDKRRPAGIRKHESEEESLERKVLRPVRKKRQRFVSQREGILKEARSPLLYFKEE